MHQQGGGVERGGEGVTGEGLMQLPAFYSNAAVCCSISQCVAVWFSMLQCVAVCCSVWQCVAVCWMTSHITEN